MIKNKQVEKKLSEMANNLEMNEKDLIKEFEEIMDTGVNEIGALSHLKTLYRGKLTSRRKVDQAVFRIYPLDIGNKQAYNYPENNGRPAASGEQIDISGLIVKVNKQTGEVFPDIDVIRIKDDHLYKADKMDTEQWYKFNGFYFKDNDRYAMEKEAKFVLEDNEQVLDMIGKAEDRITEVMDNGVKVHELQNKDDEDQYIYAGKNIATLGHVCELANKKGKNPPHNPYVQMYIDDVLSDPTKVSPPFGVNELPEEWVNQQVLVMGYMKYDDFEDMLAIKSKVILPLGE